jgi:hypothetical protein
MSRFEAMTPIQQLAWAVRSLSAQIHCLLVLLPEEDRLDAVKESTARLARSTRELADSHDPPPVLTRPADGPQG